ncbi:MAG: lysozyme [Brachybacterium faecium]|nr:MAG: lysozyme [Brachybacterium faecium]
MPRFTREQVRRRQRIAVAALALVLLLVIGGCTALVANLAGGGDTPRRADDAAMTVGATPADAPALTQLPEGAQLTAEEAMGIDVSSYQRDIDWEQVAGDGYVFAYIKATEGTGFVDTHFRQNWDGAHAVGITPGAYHYFTLCSPGAEQAASFLAAAPPDDAALPPALDLEFDGACDARPEAADAQAQIDAFTYEVEKAWGRRMVIYSSSEWRAHYGLPVADSRPDWLYSDLGRPSLEDWSVWQLRFDGTVAGIEGPVDIDVVRIEVLREHAAIARGEDLRLPAPDQE